MANRIQHLAMRAAQDYYLRQGYMVEDVSATPGHNGYDLLATRDGSKLRIEVKGCSRPWKVPDLYETEFDANHRLVADVLCVIYFAPNQALWACVIPRDAIPPDVVQPRKGYRLSGRFKNEKVLQPYRVQLP